MTAPSGSFGTRHPVWSYLALCVLPVAVTITVARAVLPHSDGRDLTTRARLAFLAGNAGLAETRYTELVRQAPENITNHRFRILAHFQAKSGKAGHAALTAEYLRLSGSPDPWLADIGLYGLGLIQTERAEPTNAIETFLKIPDRSFPFLNNSLGYAYLSTGDFRNAERYLLREIGLKGFLAGAVPNLSRLYAQRGDIAGLKRLAGDRTLRRLIPSDHLHLLYFRTVDAGGYLGSYARDIGRSLSPWSFLAAAAVLAFWLFFLSRVDIFEPEKPWWLLLTSMAGMALSLGCFFLYDFYHFILGFSSGGSPAGTLAYCILGIGLIEESVKLLPVLILHKFSRQLDESVDYMVYGSASALGFAFMENMMYFTNTGFQVVTPRALTATLLHMSLTGIVLYGFLLARNRPAGAAILIRLAGFAIAAGLHGVYDFFLIEPSFHGGGAPVSLALLLGSVVLYSSLLRRSLEQSSFFNSERAAGAGRMTFTLVSGITLILLVQFVAMLAKFGPENATFRLSASVFQAWFFLMVMGNILGNFRYLHRRPPSPPS